MKQKKPDTDIELCPEQLIIEAQEKELVRWLLRENIEFQRLGREYAKLENEFLNLSRTPSLTPQQETQKKVVSKLKDIKKERMSQILRSYKRRNPSAPQ